jgi:two-component system response regulator
MKVKTAVPILYAEDDQDDWLLMQMAHRDSGTPNPIVYLNDGREVIEYLEGIGDRAGAPRPGLILLDLNMPGLDGLATLQWLKANPTFSQIPVIILTTSNSQTDIAAAYASGANTYIVKPRTSIGLIEVLTAIDAYWFGTAALPRGAAQ